MSNTASDTPSGFTCEVCGKEHPFTVYVFAHWPNPLTTECDKCLSKYTVIAGRATLKKRGEKPCCGTCALWDVGVAKDKAGRVQASRAVRCGWRSTEPWPASIDPHTHRPIAHYTTKNDGTNCACYTRRAKP